MKHRSLPYSRCVGVLLPGLFALQAIAADELETVTVQGSRYDSKLTLASKVPVSAMELPSSVSVVTASRAEDQNLTTVDAALATVTGVTVVPNSDAQSQYRARGFPLALMNDGVPAYSSLSGFQQLDLIVYERLEVLRGPNGILQGTADPGGSLNLVSKRALDQFHVAASLTGGSWDSRRATLDVTGPLAGSGALKGRAALAWQQRDSYVDYNHNDRRVGYGTLEWTPLQGTTVTGSVAWQDDHTVAPYNGLPAGDDGHLLDVPRSTIASPAWPRQNWDTTQYHFGASQQLGHGWTATANWSATDQELFFHDAFTNSDVSSADGTVLFARREYDVDYRRRAFDANLQGPFRLFGREQWLLVGFNHDALTTSTRSVDRNSSSQPRLPLTQSADLPDFSLPYEAGSQTNASQDGVYAQLRMKPVDQLTVLLGTRLSNFEARRRNIAPSVQTAWSNTGKLSREWVPYAGLVYAPRSALSFYGSYSSVFLPQSTQLSFDGNSLPPRIGAQYELGSKVGVLEGRLEASAALFRIRDHNRALADPDHPGFFTTAGLVKSQGWEIEVRGGVGMDIDLIAGVSRTESRYVRAPASRIGTTFDLFEPEYLWRFWGVKRVPVAGSTWRVGVGLAGQSELEDPPRRQGSFTLLNMLVGYEVNARYTINLNVANVLDKVYLSRVGISNSYNTYGAPRNASLTVRMQY